MKNLKTFALAAFALLGFAACQQEEFAPEIKNPTHSVTFVAGAPESTKTTVNIEGTTAKFAWTAEDEDRFNLYENSTRAKLTKGTLTDGIMTIKAEFEGGVSAGENTYVAVYNSANDLQILYKEAYTEDADILVSKTISSFDENIAVKLQFKREVAIAKMTLKGLDAGEVVNHITVSSTAHIAGSYNASGWHSTKTSLDIYSAKAQDDQETYSIVANDSGEAVVWFTCIPQDATTLTVKVEAADGDTYTKVFSKAITLSQGNVSTFGVAMTKDAKVVPSYSIKFYSTTSGEQTVKTTTQAATFITEGTKYVTTTPYSGITSCFYGGNGGNPLRIGTSSGIGAITIALSEEGTVPATKIILSAKQFTANKGKKIGVFESDKQVATNDYSDLVFDLDGTEISAITLKSTGYIFVQSITVEYDGVVKTKLPTPADLIVSNAKVVSWNAVDGAASYVLTIGSDEFSCKSNSYDASAIADEYYDVAVVAVPSDTENYKNSDAATLTDAKFGTPTLTTPELSASVLEETSVAFSWTKDTRATNGYHWALYNGETLIKEATETSATKATVTGLSFGTTYTAKVYAVAVEGEKTYSKSETASLDLKTKVKTTISTIVSAGTGTSVYAISDLIVVAAEKPNYVVKDETGLMFCYIYADFSVGDVVTFKGTYVDYQGLKEFKPTEYNKTSTSTVNHGIAADLNSGNVEEYVQNPGVKYVKVNTVVGADGSLKIGETAIYYFGSSLKSSYAGRVINLYGYTLGYNTNTSKINIIYTNVEIDETAPYLAINQNSNTWTSDNTAPFIVNVTTNSEGENDWKVSPETLSWASLTVDKTAGTITIVPNGENRTGTDYQATLTVTHAADESLKQEISLTQETFVSVTGVELDKSELSLAIGKTATLKATINPSNATNKNVTWSSDAESVATVVDGVVSAIAEGKATITVTTEDGEYSANCTINVTAVSTWVLVEQLSGLSNGTYIISALDGDKYYAVPNTTIDAQTFTCKEGEYDKSNKTLTPADGSGEFEFIPVDGVNNAFYIYNTNLKKYLAATGSKKFGYVDSGSKDYGYWTFSVVSSGGFSGKYSVTHSSKTHYMRAFSNSVRCYDSTTNQGVYFFKKK